MFYSEKNVIESCSDNPLLIFDLINREEFELVDMLISKKIVNINTVDNNGNDVVTRLLKAKEYDLVLKYIKMRDWDINHQNNEGNTFAHYLVSTNYVHVVDIIKALKRRKNLIPNLKNSNDETILDKSINSNSIYATLKIIEDKRFNNIDVISFKKMYDKCIKNTNYGVYSKLNNLDIIVDSLGKKDVLLPGMKLLLDKIVENKDLIKKNIKENNSKYFDEIIDNIVVQAS